jgi:hypothetical protein
MQNPIQAITEILNEVDDASELLMHPNLDGNLRVAREKLRTTSRIARIFMKMFATEIGAASEAATSAQIAADSQKFFDQVYGQSKPKAVTAENPPNGSAPHVPGSRSFYSWL